MVVVQPNPVPVDTSDKEIAVLGAKRLILQVGAVDVTVYFSYSKKASKDGDSFTIPATMTYKFTAPDGKLFWYLLITCASSSTLSVAYTNMDVEHII